MQPETPDPCSRDRPLEGVDRAGRGAAEVCALPAMVTPQPLAGDVREYFTLRDG